MSFSTVLSHFEYYNCCNSETGKYTAFYIPVTDKIETYLDYNRSGKYENYDYSYLNETNILF